MRTYLILLFHPLSLASYGTLSWTRPLFHQAFNVVLVALLSPLRLI
jgi:hypothetical protein